MLRRDEASDHPLRRRRAESRPGNGCLHCRAERRLLRRGRRAVRPGTHNTAEWHALILGLRLALQARRAACGGQGRLDARGEANQPRVEDKECGATVSADAGRGAVGAVRELARRVDSAQGEPAHRQAGAGAMSPRTLYVSVGGHYRLGRGPTVRSATTLSAALREEEQRAARAAATAGARPRQQRSDVPTALVPVPRSDGDGA
jgi:hypothetical protein